MRAASPFRLPSLCPACGLRQNASITQLVRHYSCRWVSNSRPARNWLGHSNSSTLSLQLCAKMALVCAPSFGGVARNEGGPGDCHGVCHGACYGDCHGVCHGIITILQLITNIHGVPRASLRLPLVFRANICWRLMAALLVWKDGRTAAAPVAGDGHGQCAGHGCRHSSLPAASLTAALDGMLDGLVDGTSTAFATK